MKILIIDDEKYRHDWFDKVLCDHELWHAYDCDRALRWFEKMVFDWAFFDHDLADKDFTGSTLATALLNNIDNGMYQLPHRVWVHSMNRDGARNIASKFRCFPMKALLMESIAVCMQQPEEFVLRFNRRSENASQANQVKAPV